METIADPGALLEKLASRHPKVIDLGLDRVKRVGERLGVIQPLVPVITIGGTNGKGSTVAFLEALFMEAGKQVVAYTSPHLFQFNERIRWQSQPVTNQEIVAAILAVHEAVEDTTLSYFEYATLAAFYIFHRKPADYWIIEVGLGGRLDAVNVLDPSLAIITSIDFDHTEWLGDTREAIAREKAGIFRQRIPVISGESDPPETLIAAAKDLDCPYSEWQRDFCIENQIESWSYIDEHHRISSLPQPRLLLNNAAIAIRAFSYFMPLVQSQLSRALLRAYAPGRIEKRVRQGKEIWYDVSHNPHGTRLLAETLKENPGSGRLIAVVSFLARKAIKDCLAPLVSLVDDWYSAALSTEDAASETQLMSAFSELGLHVNVKPSLQEAFDAAIQFAESGDRIIVFGSFVTVSELMPSS